MIFTLKPIFNREKKIRQNKVKSKFFAIQYFTKLMRDQFTKLVLIVTKGVLLSVLRNAILMKLANVRNASPFYSGIVKSTVQIDVKHY